MTQHRYIRRYPLGEYRGYLIYLTLLPVLEEEKNTETFIEQFEAVPRDIEKLRTQILREGYTIAELTQLKTAIDDQIEYETMIFKSIGLYRNTLQTWKEPTKKSLETDNLIVVN